MKFKVYPWTISIINSSIPQPKGKIRQQIINGLLDIYDQWLLQLASLGQPYYLKIWLYEPRLLESQVVCALGERIDYYESLFSDSNDLSKRQAADHNPRIGRLAFYNWKQYRDDEIYIVDEEEKLSDYDYKSTNWIRQQLKKAHEVKVLEDNRKLYFVRRGNLWVGCQ